MKIRLLVCLLVLGIIHGARSQQEKPVWDIGTRWTYEFTLDFRWYSFVTNEITDTTTINNMKLYVVESFPIQTGIRYFYFDENKVYNYDPGSEILQLVYDFENSGNQMTRYRPLCDPYFDYDNDLYKEYTIVADSTPLYQMPDGSTRPIQYLTIADTLIRESDTIISTTKRTVLHGIGFLQGGIHHTHDWELGKHICDGFTNFVTILRCFEGSDGTKYTFTNYTCDSTWIETITFDQTSAKDLVIYPNPVKDLLTIQNAGVRNQVRITDMKGRQWISYWVESGINSVDVSSMMPGMYFMQCISSDGKSTFYRLIKN